RRDVGLAAERRRAPGERGGVGAVGEEADDIAHRGDYDVLAVEQRRGRVAPARGVAAVLGEQILYPDRLAFSAVEAVEVAEGAGRVDALRRRRRDRARAVVVEAAARRVREAPALLAGREREAAHDVGAVAVALDEEDLAPLDGHAAESALHGHAPQH